MCHFLLWSHENTRKIEKLISVLINQTINAIQDKDK